MGVECRCVNYFVPGRPAGEHRPRAFSRNSVTRLKVDSRSRSSRVDHVHCLLEDYPDLQPCDGTVIVCITSIHLPAKDHWPGKPCNRKPDLDNVAKLVLDALNGVAYADDRQVEAISLRKRWAEPGEKEGTRVHLELRDYCEKPKRRGK